MTQEEFKRILKAKGYGFTEKDGGINVDHKGFVDLRNLTTLPENTAFNNAGYVNLWNLTTLPENTAFNNKGYVDLWNLTTLPENTAFNNAGGVNLRNLTTLPENTAFNNAGSVDLWNLTTLPENTAFNNAGSVNLRSLTTLPENTAFNNAGYVNLWNLTTLPENTAFNNKGYVDLRNLTGERISYRGKALKIESIDGYTMIMGAKRKIGDGTACKARYFKGGEIKAMPQCYVAQIGEHYAHGDTVEKALRDARFKHEQVNFNPTELVQIIKSRKTVTFNDFRLLTGACENGLTHGMAQAGIDTAADVLPLDDVLRLASGPYGQAFRKVMA